MTPLWIGSLVALLLPVPLSFFVVPAAGVSPDPWRIRRARLAIVGFAGLVAVTQIAYFWYVRGLSRTNVGPPAWGVLLWVPMVWFLLVSLVVQLRRPAATPLQRRQQRRASLSPRHRLTSNESAAWWCVAAIWIPVAGWVLLRAPTPIEGLALLGSSGLHLVLGPFLARRGALVAEPLLGGNDGHLRGAYAMRRRLRARAILAVIAVGVAWQTLAAAVIAWDQDIGVVIAVLKASAAVMVFALVATGALELWLRGRVRDAQAEADRPT